MVSSCFWSSSFSVNQLISEILLKARHYLCCELSLRDGSIVPLRRQHHHSTLPPLTNHLWNGSPSPTRIIPCTVNACNSFEFAEGLIPISSFACPMAIMEPLLPV